jgi:hypothetical protein
VKPPNDWLGTPGEADPAPNPFFADEEKKPPPVEPQPEATVKRDVLHLPKKK